MTLTHFSGRVISARELAILLGLAPATVQRWAKAGRIPCLRLSARCIRFDPEVVRAVLSDKQRKGGVP